MPCGPQNEASGGQMAGTSGRDFFQKLAESAEKLQK
jgi:hypothetical protein